MWQGLQNGPQNARKLVGAGGPTLLAVDAREAGEREFRGLAFQQGAERLEVAVAASSVAEVADGSVHEVEVDLTGADESRGNGGDMADTVCRGVAQDLDIFRHFRKA